MKGIKIEIDMLEFFSQAKFELFPKHRAVREWSPERFVQQAAAIHEDVEHYIRRVLEKTRYQDQANKMCAGILNFARKAGPERLAAACRLADSYGKYRFRKILDTPE